MAGLGLFALFDNTFFVLALIVSMFGAGGVLSGSLEMGIFGAFIVFVTLAFKVDYTLFNELLYVIIVVIAVLSSFQIYNLSQNGGNET